MRTSRLIATMICLSLSAAHAQESLTVDKAVALAMERNLELQRRDADIHRAQSALGASARLPNPLLFYSREDLSLNSGKVGEWIAGGSIPLNFLWERWDGVEARSRSVDAQKTLRAHTRLNVEGDVRSAFVRAATYSTMATELDAALMTLDSMALISRQRMLQGDISEYELQRVLIELNKIRSEVRDARSLRIRHLTELGLLIGLTPDSIFSLAPALLHPEPSRTDDDMMRSAVQNRQDLKAVRLLIESEEAHLRFNRWKQLPAIQLGGGFKRQHDRFSGTTIQLSVEVPLFQRNQAEIERSQIDLDILRREEEQLHRTVIAEVREAILHWRQYEELRTSKDDLSLHDVMTTAAYAYRHGQISLVDFIDGVRAFTEGTRLRSELAIKAYESRVALKRATSEPWHHSTTEN